MGEQFKKGVFRITTSSCNTTQLPQRGLPSLCLLWTLLTDNDVVVLDPLFLTELKNLPDDTVSFGEAVSDVCGLLLNNYSMKRSLISNGNSSCKPSTPASELIDLSFHM